MKAFTFYEKSNQTYCEVNAEEKETDDDHSGDSDQDEEMLYIDIGEIFDAQERGMAMPLPQEELGNLNNNSDSEQEEERIVLPRHHRCTCHSLNLIATTDVLKIQNNTFKKLKRKVDSKLQSIWNKQSRSSLASDYNQENMGILFVIHNQTR